MNRRLAYVPYNRVFETIDPCFKCSGSLYIDQIFAVQSLPEKSARMARPENGPSVMPGDE